VNRIGSLFERLALDERLLAVGYCDEHGALQFVGTAMPPDITCQTVARTERESFSTIRSTSRPIIASSRSPVVRCEGILF
jgi:trehalose 6-phosphate synthase